VEARLSSTEPVGDRPADAVASALGQLVDFEVPCGRDRGRDRRRRRDRPAVACVDKLRQAYRERFARPPRACEVLEALGSVAGADPSRYVSDPDGWDLRAVRAAFNDTRGRPGEEAARLREERRGTWQSAMLLMTHRRTQGAGTWRSRS
jgi:hypothetical protein